MGQGNITFIVHMLSWWSIWSHQAGARPGPWPAVIHFLYSFFAPSYYKALRWSHPKLDFLKKSTLTYVIYKNLFAALLKIASRIDAKAELLSNLSEGSSFLECSFGQRTLHLFILQSLEDVYWSVGEKRYIWYFSPWFAHLSLTGEELHLPKILKIIIKKS